MSDKLPRPANNDDRAAWAAYWRAQGMPWRIESEIDEKRPGTSTTAPASGQ